MTHRNRFGVAVAAGVAAAWAAAPASRAATITLVPSGSTNGTDATAINAAGTVAGAYFDDNFNQIPYTYSPAGGFVRLPLTTASGAPLAFANATGINAAGTVVGQATTDGDFNQFAYRYTPAGGLALLGLPAGAVGARASGINNAGVVVGSADVSTPSGDQPTHGVVFQNGTATDITPTLNDVNTGIGSNLLGINAAGVATGFTAVPTGPAGRVDYTKHAIVYANGQVTDLTPALASGATTNLRVGAEGDAINAAGAVAGTITTGAAGRGGGVITSQVFLYNNGTTVALAPAGAGSASSVAAGIDAAGDVVGTSTGGADSVATLWVAGSTAGTDLNGFLATADPASAADWLLEQATGLNDAGQIVGFGQYSPNGTPAVDGYQAAFVLDASRLTAVPEPATLAAAAVVGGALLARRRRRVG